MIKGRNVLSNVTINTKAIKSGMSLLLKGKMDLSGMRQGKRVVPIRWENYLSTNVLNLLGQSKEIFLK